MPPRGATPDMGGDNSVDVVAFGGVEVEVGNEEKKIVTFGRAKAGDCTLIYSFDVWSHASRRSNE
jgi:hypothetical protein